MPRYQKLSPFKTLCILTTLLIIGITGWYIYANYVPIPYGEAMTLGFDVVTATQDGTLQWSDVLRANDVHPHVLPLVFVAIGASLSAWSQLLEVMMGFSFLVLAFILIADLCRRHYPDRWLFTLPFLALLIFSLRQHTNLLWGLGSLVWLQQTFYAVLVVWLMFALSVGWGTLVGICLVTAATMLSSGAGLVLIPLVTVMLWFRGYRIRHYILWIIFVVAALGIYQATLGGNAGTGSLSLSRLVSPTFLSVMAALVGGVFILHPEITPAIWYVISSLTGFIFLVVYVVRWLRTRDSLVSLFWVMLCGYGLLNAALIAIGRGVMWGGTDSRYVTLVIFFWVGLVGLALDSLIRNRSKRTFTAVNAALLIAITLLQLRVSWLTFQTKSNPGLLSHFSAAQAEQCFWGYWVSEGETCVNHIDNGSFAAHKNVFEESFERRLALYWDYDGYNQAKVTLPDLYREGETVIISAPEAYQHVAELYYTDRLANEKRVPPGNIFRIIQANTDLNANLTYQIGTEDQLINFIQMSDRVWYLRGKAESTFDEAFREILDDRFSLVQLEGGQWYTTVYEDITLYMRQPTPDYYFGDGIALDEWRMVSDYQLTECQPIQLEMLWYSLTDIDAVYSLGLVLIDETGNVIARKDGAPGNYITSLWKEDSFYSAVDTLQYGCNTPTGNYDLLMSVSIAGETDALSIRTGENEPIGSLLYLTTVSMVN